MKRKHDPAKVDPALFRKITPKYPPIPASPLLDYWLARASVVGRRAISLAKHGAPIAAQTPGGLIRLVTDAMRIGIPDERKFFITLVKALEGKYPRTPDVRLKKFDRDMFDILRADPDITAKDGVRELKKRGHNLSDCQEKSELLFRTYKNRRLKQLRIGCRFRFGP